MMAIIIKKNKRLVYEFISYSYIWLYFTGWFIKSSNESTNTIPQHGMKKAFLDELKAENIKKFL
jgi:glutamate carboxypeptidase II (folate hydrolase 1)